MAEETELKLRLKPDDLRGLRTTLTRLAHAPPVSQHLVSVYFDTPDLDLLRRGWALRVRRVGRHWIQTLKGGGSVAGGLHRREEREARLTRPLPDPLLLAAELPDIAADTLAPVFRTDFRRQLWRFSGDEAELEVALDQGEIAAGDQKVPVLELELELRRGPVARLYDLALVLARDFALAPEARSKAERGYQLFQGLAGLPVKAQAVSLPEHVTVEDAFVILAGQCLEQIQRNQPGVLETEEAEFVHQMRVGLRRLRALFRLFRPLLGEGAIAAWREELMWLARTLGEARDWEVLEEEVLPACAKALTGRATLTDLARRIRQQRRAARRQAREAVASPRYGQLMLGLGRWLVARDWRAGLDEPRRAALDGPLRPQAVAWLKARHRKLLARGRHLARMDDAARHALRIQAKKMRYAAEFLGSLFPGKAVRRYVKLLAGLQDDLGRLNDLASGVARVQALCARSRGSRCREEAALFTGWAAASVAQALENLPRAWKRLRHCPGFWQD